MRILQRNRSWIRARRVLGEIEKARTATAVAGRVCGETCTLRCAQCGSTQCDCRCSPHCPEAPRALSIDPERYPIEPGILPLVFAMRRQGFFTPCWSCEGHLNPDGSVWKLPSIWFYCESMVHLRLLASGLHKMKHFGKLRTSWQVAVTYSDESNLDTTFSLEPAQPLDRNLTLTALQSDVLEISTALPNLICEGAQALHLQNLAS